MNETIPELLFLAVSYKNEAEVNTFYKHVNDINGNVVSFAIADNSPDGNPQNLPLGAVTVTRTDNPGYWGGAVAALDQYLSIGYEMPNWIVLTNTDLTFASGPLTQTLKAYDPNVPLVIAPRIIEGRERTEKNPHVVLPRSKRRLLLNHLLTYTPRFALIYLVASAFRHRVRTMRAGPTKNPGGAPGSSMHSPYGAIVIFSKAFIENVDLPDFVPLLAEEWAIAELARDCKAPIVFEPTIEVFHDAHQTTGPKLTSTRARMLSTAFRYIYHEANRKGLE